MLPPHNHDLDDAMMTYMQPLWISAQCGIVLFNKVPTNLIFGNGAIALVGARRGIARGGWYIGIFGAESPGCRVNSGMV